MNIPESPTGQGFESRSSNNNNTDSPETVDQGAKNNHFGENGERPSFQTPWFGKMAFDAFWNRFIQAGDPITQHGWLIVGSANKDEAPKFHRFPLVENPKGYLTQKKDPNKDTSRDTVGGLLGYEEIRALSEKEGTNGVTGIFSFPAWFPIEPRFKSSKVIWFECDGNSLEEQQKNINELISYGLDLTLVGSGGKSIHGFLIVNDELDAEELRHFNGLFSIIGCDPSPARNVVNQMRVPGFYRASKGNEQGLYRLQEKQFYKQEVLVIFERFYADKNVNLKTIQDVKAEKELEAKKYENYEATNLGKFKGEDLKKLVDDILSQLPERISGSQTYQSYRKIGTAIARFIGLENAIALLTVHSPQQNWKTLRTCKGKFGFKAIIENMRILVDPEWNLPKWFTDKYPYKAPNNDFDIEKYKADKKTEYEKLKAFTPDITVEVPYITDSESITGLMNELSLRNIDSKGKIIVFKVPTGGGKTTLMLSSIEQERLQGRGGMLLGYRNGLLQQTYERSGNNVIDIKDEQFCSARDNMWFGGCFDSLHKVPPDFFTSDKSIVLDEFVSVLNHGVFSQTLRGKRLKCLERFTYAVQNVGNIILLDGHANDFCVDFIQKISGKEVIKIENTYKGSRPDIVFLEGAIEKEKIKKNDKSPFLKHITETIPKAPVSVSSDSCTFLESLNLILKDLGHNTLLVTGKTGNKKEVMEFKRNPVKWLEENPSHSILFNTAVESGLDINIINHFGASYTFLFGVVITDTQRQMLMRLRDITIARYVWLRAFSIDTDSSFEKKYSLEEIQSSINKEINQLSIANPAEVLDQLNQGLKDLPIEWLELAENFRKVAQYERLNFRSAFLDAVEKDGFAVERVELESRKALNTQLTDATNEVKDKESVAIFNASDKYVGKIKPISAKDESDRLAIEKAKILERLPSIEYSHVWGSEFIRFVNDRLKLINQRERWVLANNLELAKKVANKRYQRMLQANNLAPWEVKTIYLQAKAIAASGIIPFIETYQGDFTAKDEIIQKIIKTCKQAKIYKDLGRCPGQDPIKFIRWLCNQIGWDLTYRTVKDSEGVPYRLYRIDRDEFLKCKTFINAIDTALTNRFERAVLSPEISTFPPKPPEIERVNFEGSDPPQTQLQQGVESVADQCVFLVKENDHLLPVRAEKSLDEGTTQKGSRQGGVNPLESAFEVGSLVSGFNDTCVYQVVRVNGVIAHLIQPDFPDWPEGFTLEVNVRDLRLVA